MIQPFDKNKYDKRYNDIFAPTIENRCGIRAYRVDKDPVVSIPIETIEEKIRHSTFCFAEISTDNPNVWFELGFAIACGKEIVMVCCSEERTTPFPFDVRHRNIINYSTASVSDYQELSRKIEDKVKAILPRIQTKQSIKSVSAHNTQDELSNLEIDLLSTILSFQPTDEYYAIIYNLQGEMNKKSYSDAATNLAIRKLKSRNMIVTSMETDSYHSDEIPVVRLTTEGEKWLIDNENILKLTNKPKALSKNSIISGDNLPF